MMIIIAPTEIRVMFPVEVSELPLGIFWPSAWEMELHEIAMESVR